MRARHITGTLALLFTIAVGMGMITAAQPMAMPHVIFGSVTDAGGAAAAGITVRLTNTRTQETFSAQTNANGQYQADLSAMAGGYQVGDTIRVEAESGSLSGSAEVSVSSGPNDQCNVVLKETSKIPALSLSIIFLVVTGLALIAGYHRRML